MDDHKRRSEPAAAIRWLVPGILLGVCAGLATVAGGPWAALWLAAAAILAALSWWIFLEPSRWFVGFAAATLLLPPLPFPIGDSGPHVAVLFAGLGLWVGAARARLWRVPRNLLSVSAAALLLALLVSVAFAFAYSSRTVAAGSLARVALFGISIYTLFFFAYGPVADGSSDPLRWLRLLYGLGIASALFACVDFYFQLPPPARFGQQFVWLHSGVYRRAQGLFYESGVLGNLCSFFLVMMGLAWMRSGATRRIVSRKVLAAGGVVFSAALLLSFSRAALVSAAAGLAALLVLNARRVRFRHILPVLLTAAAGGAALTYVLFPAFVKTYLLRWIYTMFDLVSKPDAPLGGRLTTWRTILGILAGSPLKLIFGVGFKTLPYGGLTGEPIIADNMYVSMLAETGLIGLGAMLVFSVAVLKSAYRAARSANEAASFFGTWIFCFWIGQLLQMLSVDVLTYWRVLPLYCAVLGLAVRERDRYDRGESPSA